MRRDAARSTSLRTGYISSDAVSDGLWNRFLADARNDSEDPLFQILRFAQNDNVFNAELCRGISRYCMKISSEKLTEKFSIFNIFVK